MITAVAQAAMCLPLARLRRRAMPTLCQGGSMKMLNELVPILMPTLCLDSAQSVLMLMLLMAKEVSIVMVRMVVVIIRMGRMMIVI